ncbi:diguanylate cyclase [Dactylosporangium sp. NBC_01737]|uniref:diguanylate cyclase n=1 Tax=Dactylosporangium sp. NBC_01737 TaxID=2975959 RepID=UPI002E121DDD|nr:diguanylate cyclase [Dactylosporangium sp. NBC_01737]
MTRTPPASSSGGCAAWSSGPACSCAPPDLDTIARVELLQGRFEEAERTLLPLVDASVARRDAEGNMLPEVLLTLAEAQRLGGALDRAGATVERCQALSGQRGMVDVDAQLPALLSRAEQRGEAVSAALVDIDFFKRVNDTLSHEVGDLVLQRVATVMAGAVDEPATVARLGGEEFVVVLPGAGAQEAVARGERIRAAVQSNPWSELTGELPVTVSIGVSSTPDGRITSAALLSQADRNLCAAKRSGRNRVLADPS